MTLQIPELNNIRMLRGKVDSQKISHDSKCKIGLNSHANGVTDHPACSLDLVIYEMPTSLIC